MGFFDVPTVERKPWGILGLIFNILVPGVGSIIAGAVSGVRKTIVIGIVQFLLFWTVIVYVWSFIDGIRIFRASATTLTEVPTPASASTGRTSAAERRGPSDGPSAPGYKPQCAALTADGQQCRNSARGTSRYCSSHKGYQPPAAKGLAKRIEGESWSADDKLTDRKSAAKADTRPVVRKAKDTSLKVRKAPKKAAKKAGKKA